MGKSQDKQKDRDLNCTRDAESCMTKGKSSFLQSPGFFYKLGHWKIFKIPYSSHYHSLSLVSKHTMEQGAHRLMKHPQCPRGLGHSVGAQSTLAEGLSLRSHSASLCHILLHEAVTKSPQVQEEEE